MTNKDIHTYIYICIYIYIYIYYTCVDTLRPTNEIHIILPPETCVAACLCIRAIQLRVMRLNYRAMTANVEALAWPHMEACMYVNTCTHL